MPSSNEGQSWLISGLCKGPGLDRQPAGNDPSKHLQAVMQAALCICRCWEGRTRMPSNLPAMKASPGSLVASAKVWCLIARLPRATVSVLKKPDRAPLPYSISKVVSFLCTAYYACQLLIRATVSVLIRATVSVLREPYTGPRCRIQSQRWCHSSAQHRMAVALWQCACSLVTSDRHD